eukprot:Sdes_comp20989_c0_seq2m19605
MALDSATHDSSSYLDIRIRVFVKALGNMVNLHLCALPMFQRHTGQSMFELLDTILTVIQPNWKISLLSVASDGARNMTGRYAGVVTKIQNLMHPNCPLVRIWCGAHQLDLVIEAVMNGSVSASFTKPINAMISHLSMQHKLVAEMGTICPRIVNRWLSMDKVTSWFMKYHRRIVSYLDQKAPDCSPPLLWWVLLAAIDYFTSNVAQTFLAIQGKDTLVSTQDAELKNLIVAF